MTRIVDVAISAKRTNTHAKLSLGVDIRFTGVDLFHGQTGAAQFVVTCTIWDDDPFFNDEITDEVRVLEPGAIVELTGVDMSFNLSLAHLRTRESSAEDTIELFGEFKVTKNGRQLGPSVKTRNINVELPENIVSPTPELPSTATVALKRDVIVQGPVYFVGKFPSFGVVQPGRIRRIRIPQIGFQDLALAFLKNKPGNTTQKCNDPSAVVILAEGQATTSAQMQEVFGVAEPKFSTFSPIPFVACYRTTNPGGPLPDFVTIEIDIVPEST